MRRLHVLHRVVLVIGTLIGHANGQPGTSDRAPLSLLPLHLNVPPRDADHEVTLRWILGPGNCWELHDPLLKGYLGTLPADQFPEAFDALCRLQLRNKSDQRTALIEAWAKKDPQALWPLIKRWHAKAVDSDHFKDDWRERIFPPRVHTSLRPGVIIPGWEDFQAFERGLSQSDLEAEAKIILLNECQQSYASTFPQASKDVAVAPKVSFPPSVTADTASPPPPEVNYTIVREILAAPASAFPDILDAAVDRRNVAAVICGLRRWVMVKPTGTLGIIKWAKLQSPQHVDDVVDAWAAIAPNEVYSWLTSLPEGERLNHAREFLPYASKEQREVVLRWITTRAEHLDRELWFLLEPWTASDPNAAFEFALKHGGRVAFSECAGAVFYRVACLAEFRQPLIKSLEAFPVLVDDELEYVNMEEWGGIDLTEAARHGVHWLAKEAATNPQARFPIEHLTRVWTGKTNPEDGSMDDRTYGCLRLWAVIDPEGMKSWIETLPHSEIRQALEWLRTHAEGGFEPGTK